MGFTLKLATILLFFALLQCSLQQCYNPDGGIAPHDIPCAEFATDSDAAVPCCGTGRRCLPSKMCVSTETDTDLVRASCTDRSWNSTHCPGFCREYNQNTAITNCTAMDGRMTYNLNNFCCAGDGPQCCDYMYLVFQDTSPRSSSLLAAFASASSSSISSTSSTGSSATTSTTASAQSASDASSASLSFSGSSSSVSSSTTGNSETKTDMFTASIPSIIVAAPTTTPPDSSGSKRDWTGVGIGAGIGAAVPIIILVIVGLYLWRRHRRRALQKLLSSEEGTSSRITKDPSIRMTRPAYLKAHEADGVPRYELETVRGAEMPVRSPRELPGSEGERYRHQTYRSGCSNNPAELG